MQSPAAPVYWQRSRTPHVLWIQRCECIMWVPVYFWGTHTGPVCGLFCGPVKSACHQWLNVFFLHFYGAKMFLSCHPSTVPVSCWGPKGGKGELRGHLLSADWALVLSHVTDLTSQGFHWWRPQNKWPDGDSELSFGKRRDRKSLQKMKLCSVIALYDPRCTIWADVGVICFSLSPSVVLMLQCSLFADTLADILPLYSLLILIYLCRGV